MHQKLMFLFVCAIFFLTVPVFAAFDSAEFNSSSPLEITRITPSGIDVPPSRQIVIQFNQPVIPVGQMGQNLEHIPVEISPSCNCQWRWLNTSALACQLAQKDIMVAATKYQVTIHPGIVTQKGETLDKTYTHQFVTQRPDVQYTWFKTWKSPGMPMITVSFNQVVFKDSVSRHIYMIQGKERYAVNVEPDPDDQNPPVGKNARTLWLVSPKKELPLDADVKLEIEPGLICASGKEPGVTQRTLVTFNTFPEFKFIGVRGWTNDGKTLTIRSRENASPDNRFDPLNRISLVFSAPVLVEELKNTVKFSPDLAGGRTDYDPWANTRGYTQLNRPHKKGDDYEISLPEVLQAWKKYHVISTSPSLKDEFGRKLSQIIDTFFYTDHRKPDFHLTHKTAVLEKAVDTKMPLVITNIDKIMLKTTSLTATMRTENQKTVITPPAMEDIAFPVPMGIRNILKGKTGAVYGHISTQPPVKKSDWEHTFFAQITPFNVHVKIGHFNTLVWVTDLSTGKPVPNAKISIYKDALSRLSGTNQVQATTGKHGIAILPGTALLDPELSALNSAYNDNSDHLFVKVQKEDDLALIPLVYQFQIDTWQVAQNSVASYMKPRHGHINAWGTTAQGVYRAGDTIQYKLYVRDQNNTAFTAPPLKGYALEIIDPMGKTIHTVKDLTLSEFGAFDAEFTVPKNGASGWYSFKLSSDYTQFTWFPIQVLVTDFTPSPFRVENQLNGDLFHQNEEVHISTFARLHAGGPYAEAGMRITARLSSRYFSSDHPVAKGFSFDTDNSKGSGVHTIYQGESVLDNEGKHLQQFIIPDKDILYGQLSVESAVRDDRGKYIAASSSADYMGRDRFVGLKHSQWIYNEDQIAQIKSLVVDEHKNPVKGTDIDFAVEHLVTRAARVKGAGNAYLTQYIDEWIKVHEQRNPSTDTPVICEFTPETPGSYRVTATIKDTQGRSHSTRTWMWVAGKGRVIWQQPDDNRLEIIPEQDTYKIGDTARYLVKNPFPGATALISIERYGVIKHWTQILETSTPVIEFEVEPDFLPGFYLSVVVASPRVSDIPDEGDVDLGKPVFRMGYVSVPVKDPYKEIQVKV
ncbi:MAG: large extracellular alpha-helical protein, partial [Proteobacteria bacterium]|nr:large extracellular alpha-helical protein [Pseudomonadota bacterium]